MAENDTVVVTSYGEANIDALIKAYERVKKIDESRKAWLQTEKGKEMNRKKSKRFYENNKEKIKQKRAERYLDNHDAILTRQKEYYKKNAETINKKLREKKQKQSETESQPNPRVEQN